MTDLDQAIESITEGGQALGVSCEDVYRAMLDNEVLMLLIMEDIHSENKRLHAGFSEVFEDRARDLLKEALRTEQEQEAGL